MKTISSMKAIRTLDWRGVNSIEPDDVSGNQNLVFFGAGIERRIVVSSHEAHLRSKKNGASNPVSPADQVFGVARFIASSLTFYVVEEFVADGNIVLLA